MTTLQRFVLFIFFLPGIVTAQNQGADLASLSHPVKSSKPFNAQGKWRGVFKITNELEVPFNFEITSKQGKNVVYLLNGEERFETGKLVQTADSLFITLDPFDNELALGFKDNEVAGFFRKQNRTGNPVPVIAFKNNTERFSGIASDATGNFSGTYDIIFKQSNGHEEKAVGLFTQNGNKLTATFLRVTGDSRYLQGVVDGNKFFISSFIGSGIGYYRGSFDTDGKITGAQVSARGELKFTGVPNEFAALPDANTLTYLKDGYTSLDFSFPDVNGNKISLKDNKYKGKVVVLTITGTWCPNCVDEAYFLAPWYQKNHSRGVEALAIHYERQTDSVYVRKALGKFREKYKINYDQVIAGTADKQVVAASLPALNTFLSFPTIIIVDKKGKVAKIHTGFSGPATGKYYDEFVKDFNETITHLLNE